jgi:hypothetical protein
VGRPFGDIGMFGNYHHPCGAADIDGIHQRPAAARKMPDAVGA